MIKTKHTDHTPPHYHTEIIRGLQEGLRLEAWEVSFDSFAVSRDEKDIVASFVVTPSWMTAPADFEYMMTVKNSTVFRFTVSLTAGIRHKANGAMLALGRVKPGNKRYYKNEVEQLVQSIPECAKLLAGANKVVDDLIHTQLSAAKAALDLCEIAREKIIPWSRAGRVYERIGLTKPNGLDFALAIALEIDRASACARRDQLELRLQLSKILGI